MAKFEHQPNTGSLWPDNEVEVLRKGVIKIGEKEHFCSLLRFVAADGSEKYELAVSVAVINKNEEETKRSVNSPDFGGPFVLDGQKYKFGAWTKTAKNGTKYLSVGIEKREEPVPDDIPF